jgi:hypothetical protein
VRFIEIMKLRDSFGQMPNGSMWRRGWQSTPQHANRELGSTSALRARPTSDLAHAS